MHSVHRKPVRGTHPTASVKKDGWDATLVHRKPVRGTHPTASVKKDGWDATGAWNAPYSARAKGWVGCTLCTVNRCVGTHPTASVKKDGWDATGAWNAPYSARAKGWVGCTLCTVNRCVERTLSDGVGAYNAPYSSLNARAICSAVNPRCCRKRICRLRSRKSAGKAAPYLRARTSPTSTCHWPA